MGDRVNVNLTVLEAHAEQVRQILLDQHTEADDECAWDDLFNFTFYEVNYGNLDIEEMLQQAGIAYNKEWDAGGGFDAGVEYCRFTETGEMRLFELTDYNANPPIDQLLERIDDHVALKDYILQYKADTTILPWENQEDYGKRHLALQLIT